MKIHLLHVIAYKNMNMHNMLNPVFNYDDKRVVLEDKIHTLAHGHYTIE